jgi:hypothetical protein
VNGLNWFWISIMATAPLAGALLVGWLLWRSRQITLGNVAGTGVIFGAAFGLIMREYVEIDRIVTACFDAGDVCFPTPSAFTRFAVYAFIGLVEVFILFAVSLRSEERVRRRGYAKEWQR